MYISNRTKLLIAGVLVLIAVLLLLFFWPSKKIAPIPTANTNQQTNGQTNTPSTPKPTPTITPEQQSAASAETVAKVFAERYGSYSSESEAFNLEDLLPLTTNTFGSELRGQIDRLRASTSGVEYYGVSTRVLNATVASMSDTQASYTVLTQREEAKGSVGNTSVRYQTLKLILEKSGEQWLVASAVWE